MKKKHWKSFGELNNTEAFEQSAKNEFTEELLPLEDLDNGFLDSKSHRRDFLKYLGFSTAAAVVASGCEMQVRKSVPFLQRPDNIIPGIANYYASTYVSGGNAVPVLVKQREGRPIKIEGNELSTITKGATNAQVQASVLDLYDTSRLRYPMQKDGKQFKEVTSFEAFDKMVGTALAGMGTKPVVLLTSTINSPSTIQIISEFLAKYPGGRHVQYDAVSYSGMLLANEACYGKRAIPSYHFENAKVIVSLGADFLGSWLSPVEFNKQYSANRKVKGDKADLSRHIQFEGALSLTGSNADDRYLHKPSETGAVALALLAKLGGNVTAPAINDTKLAKGIEDTAALLKANMGAGLVVCSSNDVNVQIIVNAINEAIGANGKTIDWASPVNYRKGIDADMVKLVDDMNTGNVGALLIYDTNPAYTYADSNKFIEGLNKVVSISFNAKLDETTELCKYVIPSHHWLESWGDAEPKTGYFSMIQPIINPLFKTRAFQTSLLKWSIGAISDYETYFKNFWTTKLGSADLYNNALQNGVVEPVAAMAAATFSNAKLTEAASKAATKSGALEVVFYQKVSIGDGRHANNPWLQELPDPVSKVTWDNYVIMSPALAKTVLGIDVLGNQREADAYEVHPEKPVVKLTANGKSVELPVMIIPGNHPNVIAAAVGYGRQSADASKTAEYIGKAANGAGKNVYPLVGFDGTGFTYTAEVKIEKTDKTYKLAQTQVHAYAENRPIIYETNQTKFNANPASVLGETKAELSSIMAEGTKDFVKDATIYPYHDKPGVKWGMSIDLNSCTGCSACVVACIAENNVSVVGKTEVARYHDMHWLRIDRYFTGDPNNPDVVFQPMLCQHCDNAPCENVCPVAATNHSSEGINQMAYNRCIGTRYCANNCPYKVRRFNWLDYTGSDSFPDNQKPLQDSYLDDVVFQMNDDLTRMVLNPDVTVRSRGVMEKCSFCVQRLQAGKLEAKKQQDPAVVRNLQTACAQACPTNAIMFGNVNDEESEVYKIRSKEQVNRNFYVLDQLHTLPNVNYLAKVRNTDRHIGMEEHEEAAHEEKEHS